MPQTSTPSPYWQLAGTPGSHLDDDAYAERRRAIRNHVDAMAAAAKVLSRELSHVVAMAVGDFVHVRTDGNAITSIHGAGI